MRPDLVPIRSAGRSSGRMAGSLADALGGKGAGVRRRRWVGNGEWLVAAAADDVSRNPELVVVPSHDVRGSVETAHPHLVGRVWVWDGVESSLPGLLLAKYRPPDRGYRAKVGVVGYNLKFARPIIDHLARLPGVEIRLAEWPKYAVASPVETEAVLSWADTVWCEWAGPNAVLASRRLRPEQRLIVRLHRFELERDDWRNLDTNRVGQVITVGDHYRELTLERTGWPSGLVTVVPNPVDIAQFDRPKHDFAGGTIGLLGATPWRKRPDRALDVLDHLVDEGHEVVLTIKGARPGEERWMREDPDQMDRYRRLAERIETADVRWEPHGPQVAEWFRGVEFILSTSDDESFHLAPAEGMASGTVPVIWPWPGAELVYDSRWIVTDAAEAAAAITATGPDHRLAARREVAGYDLPGVLEEWERLLFAP